MDEMKEIHKEARKRWDQINTGKETWGEFIEIYSRIKNEVEVEYNKKK